MTLPFLTVLLNSLQSPLTVCCLLVVLLVAIILSPPPALTPASLTKDSLSRLRYGEKLGLVLKNRKKNSQIINDYLFGTDSDQNRIT